MAIKGFYESSLATSEIFNGNPDKGNPGINNADANMTIQQKAIIKRSRCSP